MQLLPTVLVTEMDDVGVDDRAATGMSAIGGRADMLNRPVEVRV